MALVNVECRSCDRRRSVEYNDFEEGSSYRCACGAELVWQYELNRVLLPKGGRIVDGAPAYPPRFAEDT